MIPRKKLLAGLIMTVILLPNILSITLGRESFPYTNAPMFGHYVGESTYFYSIRFFVQDGSTEKRIYPYYGKPKNNVDYMDMRLFFNKVYGSVEKKTPFGHFENDTSEKLEVRINNFFTAYFRYLLKEESTIKKVRLEVAQFDNEQKPLSSHTIGYYDIETKRFAHTWKKADDAKSLTISR